MRYTIIVTTTIIIIIIKHSKENTESENRVTGFPLKQKYFKSSMR